MTDRMRQLPCGQAVNSNKPLPLGPLKESGPKPSLRSGTPLAGLGEYELPPLMWGQLYRNCSLPTGCSFHSLPEGSGCRSA